MTETRASDQTVALPRPTRPVPRAVHLRGAPSPARRAARMATKLRPADLVSLVQITAIMVFVEVALRTVPLARLADWLGVPLRLSVDDAAVPSGPPTGDFGPHERRKARGARWLLAHWPFGAGPCLREALVVGYVLRRYQPSLRLGVARDGQAIVAHAWLEVGGVSLEGYRGFLPLGH